MFSRYLWRLIIRKFRITPVHHSKESFQKIACLYRFRRLVNYTVDGRISFTRKWDGVIESGDGSNISAVCHIIVFSAEISVARRK
jgi:hypothetical protein